jgi:SNF2 family DNA or RNA helicase/uncharacterized Zn finger protein
MIHEIEYGKTWWGKQWLEALLRVDDKRRLELGQKYTRSGAVRHFSINSKNVIEGSVLGIGGKEHQQSLQLIALTLLQKKILLDELQKHPYLLTQLLNRQLPKETLEIAKKENISLLPKDWSAFRMACSCSEWALPCKHLAAVICTIVNQIDQNPFLLFKLLGLDIIAELKEQTIELEIEKITPIASLDTFALNTYAPQPFDVKLVQQLDFSNIKNQSDKYWQLLDNKCLFYNGNFKKVLQKNAKKAYRVYKKQVYPVDDYADLHHRLKKSKDLALIIDTNNQPINLFVINKEKNVPLFTSDRVISDCIGILETIEEGQLPRYADSFIALQAIYRFSIKLLEEQNFLPRLVHCPEGYTLQWIPAYNINKHIASLIDKLIQVLPSDLLLLETDKLKILEPREQVLNLCHLFISHFIQLATEMTADALLDDKKVEYCFFSGLPTPFDRPNEQEVARSIDLWLQPFYLGHQQYAPALKVMVANDERTEFFIKIVVENRGDKTADLIGLATFLKQKQYAEYSFVVLGELNRLANYFPDLKAILASNKTENLSYSGVEFEEVFFEILPILKMLNISILLPRSLQQLTRPRLGLSISKKKEEKPKGKSFMNVKSLLELNWSVALGDEMIEALEFLKMIKGKRGFIKYNEKYIHLDQEQLERILEQLKTPPVATANQVIHAVLSNEFKEAPVEVSQEVKELMKALRITKVIAAPKGLKATLRPYQEVGYSWMYKNAQLGLGSLIADDMGLGKTLQIISLLLKFKEEGRLEQQQALVIVPTSLLTNWMNEIKKFAPLLLATTYHGTKRTFSKQADIIITTYGVARIDLKLLNQLSLYCTIIDEAQNIKNVNTAQTEAVKSIKATLNIAMSGTPVENRLSEYWSIMDYVNPNYLGSIAQFATDYSDPIEKHNDQEKLNAFRKITAPFILRRLKSDKSIIKDLPDKIEQNYYATLQQEQAEVYKNIVDDTLRELSKTKEDKKKRQGLVLKLMGGLKQVCNHPYQYMKMGRKGPECSGKSQLLMDLLGRIQVQQEKVLLFTQYRKMGNLISEWVQQKFGFKAMYLHGGCSRKQRDEMVDAFQNNKQETIFILSLKAAGTGLNLTAANHVIHYDLWWNPAVEAQATDRAYRIGQKKNVQVYRFITKGTLEEKIDAMIQSKKELADLTVSTGEKWLGDLSDDDLRELLVLD